MIDIDEYLWSNKGGAAKKRNISRNPTVLAREDTYALAIENSSAGMRALAPALTIIGVRTEHVLK